MDVNVRDFGAVGDDSTDDTLAFRNALNAIRATGGTCFVPAGVYKIAPTGITGSNSIPAITSEMHLVGEVDANRQLLSSIHVHTKATKTIILCYGSKWSIEKMRVIMPSIYETDAGAGPITVGGGGPIDGWTIDRCEILNTGHFAIVARGARYTISRNYVFCTYAAGTGAHPLHEGIIITTGANNLVPSNGNVFDNTLDGVGINAITNNTRFVNNHIMNHGYGSGIFIGGSLDGYSHDNIFIGNLAEDGKEGIDDSQGGAFFQVSGFEIWSPRDVLFRNIARNNCGGGFALGGRSSIISFNRAVNNGKDTGNPSHEHKNGFNSRTLTGQGSQHVNNSGSLYLGNFATDTHAPSSKMQDYGLFVQADNIRCLAVIGNNFHGNKLGEGLYRMVQPNVGTLVGRDLYEQICNPRMKEDVRAFLDNSKYTISDEQYVMLNEVLYGSSNPR